MAKRAAAHKQDDNENNAKRLRSDATREKIIHHLSKNCPLMIPIPKADWANQLCDAIQSHYQMESEQLAKARTLCFNLKRNGEHLAKITPNRLVLLSSEELSKGTFIERKRQQARLGGWKPPPPPPRATMVLPTLSSWNQSTEKKMTLVLRDDALIRDYTTYFETIPRVDIAQGDITKIKGECDAFVSPANTMGNMDGGIDKVYADYLGWSYGRPYHPPNPLQIAIDKQMNENNSQIDIGKAILVRDSYMNLIAAPTMVLPSKIPVNSKIIYDATKAAFEVWKQTKDIQAIRMPAFGTGFGLVPGPIAAAQTFQAFCEVLRGLEMKRLCAMLDGKKNCVSVKENCSWKRTLKYGSGSMDGILPLLGL